MIENEEDPASIIQFQKSNLQDWFFRKSRVCMLVVEKFVLELIVMYIFYEKLEVCNFLI